MQNSLYKQGTTATHLEHVRCVQLPVKGMRNSNVSQTILTELHNVPGVLEVKANLIDAVVDVRYNSLLVDISQIKSVVKELIDGYSVAFAGVPNSCI